MEEMLERFVQLDAAETGRQCEHPIITLGWPGQREGRLCGNGATWLDRQSGKQYCGGHKNKLFTEYYEAPRVAVATPARNVAYVNTMDGFVEVNLSGSAKSALEVIRAATGDTIKIIDATAITVLEVDKLAEAALKSSL